MANEDLVGNLNTEWLLGYFAEKGGAQPLHLSALKKSLQLADEIFI
jgi:hydroxymethylglutaryl-CoA lyase